MAQKKKLLDKRKANLWVQIVAVAVAAAFIALGAFQLVDFSGGPQQPRTSGTDAADQQALQLITQLQAQLSANPTSTALLEQLGNAYYDLANTQAQSERQVLAKANFELAVDSYAKVLKARSKDTDVRTDMATALYYSGDTGRAIVEIEKVLKLDPKHQNALFNAGVFYRTAGDTGKARGAWQRYLEFYPNSQGAQQVKSQLSQLK